MRRVLIVAALLLVPSTAFAEGWHGSVAGGYDLAFSPETNGFGFALFEATGEDKVGKGDRARRAQATLQQRYPNSSWARQN